MWKFLRAPIPCPYRSISDSRLASTGNVLAQVQRVHESIDLWITFCTRRPLFYRTNCTRRSKSLMHAMALPCSIPRNQFKDLNEWSTILFVMWKWDWSHCAVTTISLSSLHSRSNCCRRECIICYQSYYQQHLRFTSVIAPQWG